MTESKIPLSVQKVLDVFIRSNFNQYRYKVLADKLGLKIDTLIQRIRRNKEYFDIDDSERPTRISVKEGIEEVYFYRDKNKCQLCQQFVAPDNLSLKFRNPFHKNKFEWNNVLSVCEECKDKESVKKVKQILQSGAYEYKDIYINSTSMRKDDKWFNYFEFDEHDGFGFLPLFDENNQIASMTVSDILNYFSADGWEALHLESSEGEYDEGWYYQVFFKRRKGEK